MATRKGLLVEVYRAANRSDCTNGGVTSRVDHCVLVGIGVPEIFEPSERTPALELCTKSVGGELYHYARPVLGPDDPRKNIGPMNGGNFVYTSDSRLPCGRRPIPVHDRWETQEQYDALSR